METQKQVINEVIHSHPVAFDAALDAKIAGADAAGQRQAALDAYRDSKGWPRIAVKEQPVPIDEKTIVGEAVSADVVSSMRVEQFGKKREAVETKPLPADGSAVGGEAQLGEESAQNESRFSPEVSAQLYGRWQLATLRAFAHAPVDFDALESYERDDILALKGRRLSFSVWLDVRFPE